MIGRVGKTVKLVTVHEDNFVQAIAETDQRHRSWREKLGWVHDVLADDTFDLITISFATRNINLSEKTLIQTLKEFHRVLKVGGHFVNLETSQPSSPLVRRVFHAYVRLLVAPIGRGVSGSRSAYAYLAHTVPRFYLAEELARILVRAGFRDVRIRRLALGVAAIHQGTKV